MVSSISRNYISGLSSGLDTEALIEQTIKAESFSKFSLERKRNTLTYKQEMLREVNLALYNLQTKASDLSLSKTFTSKKVSSSDEKLVTAKATTGAAVGSYTVKIKQIATASSVASSSKLAGALQNGELLTGSDKIGGTATKLSVLGVSNDSGETFAGLNIDLTASNGSTHSLSLSNISEDDTVGSAIQKINAQIASDANFKDKVRASYDEKNNQIRFNLLDNSVQNVTFTDASDDGLNANLFGSAVVSLNSATPAANSNKEIRSGLETLKSDLGLKGSFSLTKGATSVTINLDDLDSFPEDATMEDIISEMNRQLGQAGGAFSKSGVATSNPANYASEFRYNDVTGKLELINTDSTDTRSISVTDDALSYGNFASTLFGSSSATTGVSADDAKTLSEETFASKISSGKITVDGVQIDINADTDKLSDVLSRITSLTNVRASYDSNTDTISFTRKDGSSAAIGVGSATDSSNFLRATGMISGSQSSAAVLTGSSQSLVSGYADTKNAIGASGAFKITVNGETTEINYSETDSYQDVLKKMASVNGVEQAYYDVEKGRFVVQGSDKGSSSRITVADSGAGTLISGMGLNGTAEGKDFGSTLTGSRSISGINSSSSSLDEAGFVTPVSTGKFSINGVEFEIKNTSNTTVDSIIQMINSNDKVGATAQYDPTSGQFILTSKETGNQSIAIGAPTDTSNFLSAMGLTNAVQNIGQNAIFSVDGLYGGAEQVSQTNVIGDAVEGVIFELKNVTTGAGETINVSVDTDAALEAVKGFVESYNEVTELIYKHLTSEPNKELTALSDEEIDSLDDETLNTYIDAYKVGLLRGDSTLRTIRSQMRAAMSAVVKGVDSSFNSLSDIGITTGTIGSSYTETMLGKISITNEDALKNALANNPNEVAALFNESKEGVGIAKNLKDVLNAFTSSTGILTKRVGRSDSSVTSQMDTQIKSLNQQIASQQSRLVMREEALLKQFSALESAMSEYQSQSSSFASMLSQGQSK
ncbi:MAG: Flagellar hook-associated protein 2 [bacterium ADurb.Bin157]|nr:MAG: Flagellar hook-associated protein 2 [bacterium ADurb.Bin157]